MTIPIRQVQDGASPTPQGTAQGTAQGTEQGYDVALAKAIAEAASDPARLRELFHAMAARNPRLDTIVAESLAHATKRARTIFELEQMLRLERTAKRAESPWRPPGGPPNVVAGPKPWLAAPSGNPAPDRAPRPAQFAAPIGMQAEAPMQEPYAMRLSVKSVAQIGAATVIGIALCLGISAWVHWLRPVATHTARATPPRVMPTNVLPGAAETVGYAQPRRIEPPPATQSRLPFPLPVGYGVYAGSDSQLIELEPLPVEVPPSRSRTLSAEITRPSRAVLPGQKLAFVVFKQNVANDVPAAVSARVVGRVSRAITFVNLRAKVTPLESSWRIRDKAYEFKVSPVEGSREMFLIQPDAALPAGRYALVLNGYGYDFTVAGPITAPEQCLEQTHATNGLLVTECPD
jgi:hypothetical protein